MHAAAPRRRLAFASAKALRAVDGHPEAAPKGKQAAEEDVAMAFAKYSTAARCSRKGGSTSGSPTSRSTGCRKHESACILGGGRRGLGWVPLVPAVQKEVHVPSDCSRQPHFELRDSQLLCLGQVRKKGGMPPLDLWHGTEGSYGEKRLQPFFLHNALQLPHLQERRERAGFQFLFWNAG